MGTQTIEQPESLPLFPLRMQNKRIEEQCVLISGGGSGIGKAFARALLEKGFGTVVIASRRQSILDSVACELQALYPRQRVMSFVFDQRDRTQTERLVEFALDHCGAIDVLINNAGIAVPESVESITTEGWEIVMDTNLRGAMWLTQLLLPKNGRTRLRRCGQHIITSG